MLYKRKDLPERTSKQAQIAVQRYLYKFYNHRSEIKKLKWHEKHYLFSCMHTMTYNGGEKFDMLSIPEAREWAFDYLLLIYIGKSRKIDFSVPARDYRGRVSESRKRKHMAFFWKCMDEWQNELESGKGIYCSVLRTEYLRKVKWYESKPIPSSIKRQRIVYMRATFFHIYSIIRMYFDEKPDKYAIETIRGYHVIADIYTYCHVLSRHYFWLISEGGASLNDDIDILDMNNLPDSLLNLVHLYSLCTPLTPNTEYLLFAHKGIKYIMWLRYGTVASAGMKGFQIRSFYKCETEQDLQKYEGKYMRKIARNLICYA